MISWSQTINTSKLLRTELHTMVILAHEGANGLPRKHLSAFQCKLNIHYHIIDLCWHTRVFCTSCPSRRLPVHVLPAHQGPYDLRVGRTWYTETAQSLAECQGQCAAPRRLTTSSRCTRQRTVEPLTTRSKHSQNIIRTMLGRKEKPPFLFHNSW